MVMGRVVEVVAEGGLRGELVLTCWHMAERPDADLTALARVMLALIDGRSLGGEPGRREASASSLPGRARSGPDAR
jgi:hypothetical protein